MRLTTAIQEAVLAILCYDDTPGGASFVKALVPPREFDPFYRDVAESAVAFLEKHDKPPGDHTYDIFDQLKARDPDSETIYDRLFSSLQETRENINREYVVQQAQVFCRYQQLKRGVAEALDALEEDDEAGVTQAEAAMYSCLETTQSSFDPGTTFTDTKKSLKFLDREWDSIPCGIPEIDKRGLGLAPKRLHILLGGGSSGKSWWLVHLAKQCIKHGKRVVYVTLELSEEDVLERLMQAFFAVSRRKLKTDCFRFERDELGRFVDMVDVPIKHRPAFEDVGIRKHLRSKIERLHKPPLVVKEFPSGSLSMRELEGWLSALEGARGYIPDVLLVDYVDLMAVDARNYRLDLKQMTVALRGLAGKRKMAVGTVAQSTREGMRETASGGTLQAWHLGEDISKFQTADSVLTLNQTELERELGLLRLFQAKGRTEKDKFTVLVSQALGIGQFCLDSVGMQESYWDVLEELEEDDS